MAVDSGSAGRRVMDRLDGDRRIPLLDIPEGDVGVLFAAPLAGLVLGSLIGIDWLALALGVAGGAIGVAIVYAAPPHLTAPAWLAAVARHLVHRPAVTHSDQFGDDASSTDTSREGLLPLGVDETTQELTHVERAWQGACAIERTDGTMEAFIELEPTNMDFAMADDWMAVQEAAADFANTDLEFPLTFHATTQSFPIDRLVEQLEDRLTDPDVEANPAFQQVIEEYRERKPVALADTRQQRYFLGVEVDPMEVYERYDAEPTPGERLTAFPVIGFLFNPFVTRRADLSDEQLRELCFEKLDRRIETVQTGLVKEVPGWTGRRLPTIELFMLVTEFWNGEDQPAEQSTRLLSRQDAISRQPREADQ